MKQRIVSGVVGAIFIVILLFFKDAVIFNIFISFLSVMAMWELFVATKYIRNWPLVLISLLFAAAVPFMRNPYFTAGSKPMAFLYVLGLIIVMMFERKKVTLEQLGLVFMVGLIVPFAFSSLIYLRDLPKEHVFHYVNDDGLFFIILALLGAWATDIGAYFIGRFFGKHKLAPVVSPHKTVEGAIGGIVTGVICFLIAGLIWQGLVVKDSGSVRIWLLLILAVLCAVMGMLGDLAASYIKRTCNIKDFGRIMPGHGGVLDRFDSVLLVAPFLYVFLQMVPVIIR